MSDLLRALIAGRIAKRLERSVRAMIARRIARGEVVTLGEVTAAALTRHGARSAFLGYRVGPYRPGPARAAV